MSSDRKIDCVACQRRIDAEAKLCPYCGANPRTGQRIDTSSLVQREFRPKQELAAHETVIEYVRQRQALVVAGVIAGVFLLLFGLHRLVSYWNLTNVSPEPPKPLTEVADVAGSNQVQELPIPNLEFSYAGSSRTMRTFLVEPGAVAPPQQPAAATASDFVSTGTAPQAQHSISTP